LERNWRGRIEDSYESTLTERAEALLKAGTSEKRGGNQLGSTVLGIGDGARKTRREKNVSSERLGAGYSPGEAQKRAFLWEPNGAVQ